MWRIALSLPLWAAFFIFRTLLILVGWLVIPWCAILGFYERRKSEVNDKLIISWKFKWMWIWGNEEDGILHGRQFLDMGDRDLQIIYWTAFRNPVNNLRYVKYLGAHLVPERIKYIGTFGSSKAAADLYNHKSPLWFYCWHGLYSNVYVLFPLGRDIYKFRLGWKIWPDDIKGVSEYRKPGAGFAMQLKRIVKGAKT